MANRITYEFSSSISFEDAVERGALGAKRSVQNIDEVTVEREWVVFDRGRAVEFRVLLALSLSHD